MELRVLRYFLAVTSEGTITDAAKVLHITQPNLSKQLTKLEREVGCTLFIRGSRRITLTEEGRLLQRKARGIVDSADETLHRALHGRGSSARVALRSAWADEKGGRGNVWRSRQPKAHRHDPYRVNSRISLDNAIRII